MQRAGTMGMLVMMALVARAVHAQATDSAAAAKDSLIRARIFLRPLASLLVPGTGQLLAHQDRGAVYLAAEVYLVSRFAQLDREAVREADRFKELAFDIARRPYLPTQRDTIFEYFEQMERFMESGRYDAGSGSGFVPESDPRTYNGAVWLLARRTDRKSTRLNSSHSQISYAVFCLKKKKKHKFITHNGTHSIHQKKTDSDISSDLTTARL